MVQAYRRVCALFVIHGTLARRSGVEEADWIVDREIQVASLRAGPPMARRIKTSSDIPVPVLWLAQHVNDP